MTRLCVCSSVAKLRLSDGAGALAAFPEMLSARRRAFLERRSNKFITCVFSFSTATFLYLEIINFN